MSKLVSDTGKTIDDYRNIIKTLKTRNQELEQALSKLKNSSVGPGDVDQLINLNENAAKIQSSYKGFNDRKNFDPANSNIDQSFNLGPCDIVMQKFYKLANSIGMTLEMMFRAADKEGKGVILHDDFRIFLNGLKFGFSPSDVNCSGVLKKDLYYEVLVAYGVNSEKPNREQTRTIGQESLMNLLMYMKEKRINDEDAFRMCDSQSEGFITAKGLSDFYKKLYPKVSKKDRAALFHYFDFEQTGKISKDAFLDIIGKGRKGLGESKAAPGSILKSTKIGGKDLKNQVKAVIQKFETDTNQPITKLMESILLNLKNPEHGILFQDLCDAMKSFNNCLTTPELFCLFRTWDSNDFNGVIFYEEFLKSFNQVKSEKSSMKFLVINLAKTLQALHLTTEAFLEDKGLNEDSEIDRKEFIQKAMILFTIYEPEAEMLFQEIMEKEKDKFKINKLIVAINEYRSDVSEEEIKKKMMGDQSLPDNNSPMLKKSTKKYNKAKTKVEKNFTKTEINQDDKKFKECLDKLKSKYDESDFFEADKKYTTIFTNQIACLKKCHEISEELDKKGNKWEDPEFGPNPKNPQQSLMSMYFYENMVIPGCPDPETIQWLRPEEIYIDGDPVFFDEEGATSNDVMQSSFLGNCWFVSALSIIATHDELLRGNFKPTEEAMKEIDNEEVKQMTTGMYPPMFHYMRKYGVYVIKFFKNYEWIYVIIDDKLPCLQNGDVVYGKCRPKEGAGIPHEFWVSLIEKAYAKLHNCYQALFSGYIDEALADMTGYASEKRDIIKKKLNTPEEKDELWNMLFDHVNNGSMIGCSADGGTEKNIELDGEDTGLKSGHAYAVINLIELPDDSCNNYHKSHRLIRVRNPWGFGEWQLEWSENPDYNEKLNKHFDLIKKYYEELKKKGVEVEEYTLNENDGTFLMRYKDWRRIFDNLWSGRRVIGQWTEQNCGGLPLKRSEEENIRYAKNPQYILKVNRKDGKKTKIFSILGQEDGIKYPFVEVVKPVNYCAWRLGDDEILEKFEKDKLIANSGKIKVNKEICIPTFSVENGNYALIPSTKTPDMFDQYYGISIYFDCPLENIEIIIKNDENKFGGIKKIAEEEENIEEADPNLKEILRIR